MATGFISLGVLSLYEAGTKSDSPTEAEPQDSLHDDFTADTSNKITSINSATKHKATFTIRTFSFINLVEGISKLQ
jgi:hypothetical protein